MIDWINLPFQINNKYQLGELEMSVSQLDGDLTSLCTLHQRLLTMRNRSEPVDVTPTLLRSQLALQTVQASLKTARTWLAECQNLYRTKPREFSAMEYGVLHNLHQAHYVVQCCENTLAWMAALYAETWVEQAFATGVIALRRTLPPVESKTE